MLEIKNAEKKYYSESVLKGLSICFQPGEIVGLIGENGAGKTTLMKCIFGFQTLDLGTILLDGEKITPNRMGELAFATSEHSFFGNFSPEEHKEFYQMQFPKFNEKRYQLLMDFFRLPSNLKVRGFSTGQKNQFEVILALSQGARYIFMDEPFAGNDIFNREDFYKVLLGLLEPTECLVISTHLIDEIKNFVSRVVLLHQGQLLSDVTMDELEEENKNLIDYIKEKYSYQSDRIMKTIEQHQNK